MRFEPKEICFVLSHKIFFARMITAFYNQSVFFGQNEEEVINELCTELEKEIK